LGQEATNKFRLEALEPRLLLSGEGALLPMAPQPEMLPQAIEVVAEQDDLAASEADPAIA